MQFCANFQLPLLPAPQAGGHPGAGVQQEGRQDGAGRHQERDGEGAVQDQLLPGQDPEHRQGGRGGQGGQHQHE